LLGSWVRDLDVVPTKAAEKAGHTNLLDVTLNAASSELLPPSLSAGRFAASDHPFPGHWCTREKKVDTKPVSEIVASAVARDGVIGQTVYSDGATTTSSAGLSFNAGATFSVGGDITRTSELSAQYPPLKSEPGRPGAARYLVTMDHDVFRQECLTNFNGEYSVRYTTKPNSVTGAPNPVPDAPWVCDRAHNARPATGVMTAKRERAHTYSAGFSFAPTGAGSLVGETHSGYTSAVQVQFDFSHVHGQGFWCGDTGRPTDLNQRVQGFAA
jgi:hypothetical protein